MTNTADQATGARTPSLKCVSIKIITKVTALYLSAPIITLFTNSHYLSLLTTTNSLTTATSFTRLSKTSPTTFNPAYY